MKAEADAFLTKAKELLDRAPALLSRGFPEEAGRAAYLAGFHAAQAFIFETLGRSPKTHSGVQTQFAKLARSEPSIDVGLRAFLGQAYNIKAIADYEIGPGAKIAPERAKGAIDGARRFVAAIVDLLASREPPQRSREER